MVKVKRYWVFLSDGYDQYSGKKDFAFSFDSLETLEREILASTYTPLDCNVIRLWDVKTNKQVDDGIYSFTVEGVMAKIIHLMELLTRQ